MLHNTLDSQISKLHAEGIGATINQASIISYEGEYQLLHCKVMSFENPRSLFNLAFFMLAFTAVFKVAKSVICPCCSFNGFLQITVFMTSTHITYIKSLYQRLTSTDFKICMLTTKLSRFMQCLILKSAMLKFLTSMFQNYQINRRHSIYVHWHQYHLNFTSHGLPMF